jgi:two-component system response regulator YesN
MYKLIVADDEPLERRAIKRIIQDKEIPIQFAGEARNGSEAVELVEAMQPEIVFVDIKMPGMDGLEATRRILSINPETIVIIFSAYDRFEYAREGIELGAYRYILKPIKPDQVKELLQEAIREVEARKQSKLNSKNAQSRIEKIKPYIKLSLLYNLISGSLEFEDIENQELFLNMKILPGIAIVIGIDSDLTSNETDQIKKKIVSCLQGKQVETSSVLVDSIGRRKIVILMNAGDHNGIDQNAIPKILEEWRLELFEMVHAPVTIGVGRPYKSFKQIRQSYLEARKAVKYGYIIRGGNQVIHVDELDEGKDEGTPVYLKDKVTEHIMNGEWQHVNGDLRAIVKQIMKSNENEIFKRTRIMELVVVMSRATIEEGVEHQEILCLNADFYKKMTSCDHLEDLAEYLMGLSEEYKKLVNQANKSYANKIIKKSKKYIDENYASTMRLREVADAVNLSRHYFSRLFKMEAGCAFSEYVTRKRLSAAKKLLVDPSLTVAQISERVGFSDASYFSRTFKKHEAISPTEYRERVRR